MTTATTPSTIAALRERFQASMQARLPEHLARMAWSSEQIGAHQLAGLRHLLAHASANSPFHARRLAGVDVGAFELTDLAGLPVMTKSDMMSNFDSVVTDRAITREGIEAHIGRTGELPELFLDKYLCLASGGSSGTRGVFCLDWDAAMDMNLAVLRPSIARLLTSGPPPGGLVIGIVAAPTAIHATRALPSFGDGGALRIVHAPATLPLPEIVSRLNAGQPHLVIGYPAILRLLAAEKRAGRLTIAPIAVGSTSENLTPETAAVIADAFGVGVSNTFGSSEELMGVANAGDDAITLATDLAIVELVDDNDRPVAPGTPSAKALITNLYNLTQPLIRYELSDSFVQQPPAPEHGHLRVTVAGRSDEVLVYGGVTIHPLAIRSPLVKTPEVTEYQVRQTPHGVDVAVVGSAPVDEVAVRTVAAIERNPATGKTRRFIPFAQI
jgi:phenylacetate-coenzyme A ligase PaaK-like adenylate-forming protein